MSTETPLPAAGWHTDPMGRHQFRYWDGTGWTDHVATNGQQGVDALHAPAVPTIAADPARIQHQVQGQAGVAAGAVGGGTLFTEPVLVVNQKAKLIEISNEYAVFDQNGRQIGAVRQVGQSGLRKAVRVLTSYDQFLTHRMELCDMTGATLLSLTRPAKFVKSSVIVADGLGVEIGRIVQQNAIGKIRFGFEAGGRQVGGIFAENWRAWNFTITDETGSEVARISKTWEGLAKTMFTTADNYVVQVHRPLADPLRSLVVAAAVSVDTALKQDQRGLN